MSSFSYLIGFSISAFMIQMLFGRINKSFKLEQDVKIQNE